MALAERLAEDRQAGAGDDPPGNLDVSARAEEGRGEGVRPSSAQRRLLERLTGGEAIRAGLYGRLYLLSETLVSTDTVPITTFNVLRRRGWIAALLSPDPRPTWLITDTGRTALKLQP